MLLRSHSPCPVHIPLTTPSITHTRFLRVFRFTVTPSSHHYHPHRHVPRFRTYQLTPARRSSGAELRPPPPAGNPAVLTFLRMSTIPLPVPVPPRCVVSHPPAGWVCIFLILMVFSVYFIRALSFSLLSFPLAVWSF